MVRGTDKGVFWPAPLKWGILLCSCEITFAQTVGLAHYKHRPTLPQPFCMVMYLCKKGMGS